MPQPAEQVLRRTRQDYFRLHPVSFAASEPICAHDPPEPLGPRAKLQSTDELWRLGDRHVRVV